MSNDVATIQLIVAQKLRKKIIVEIDSLTLLKGNARSHIMYACPSSGSKPKQFRVDFASLIR